MQLYQLNTIYIRFFIYKAKSVNPGHWTGTGAYRTRRHRSCHLSNPHWQRVGWRGSACHRLAGKGWGVEDAVQYTLTRVRCLIMLVWCAWEWGGKETTEKTAAGKRLLCHNDVVLWNLTAGFCYLRIPAIQWEFRQNRKISKIIPAVPDLSGNLWPMPRPLFQWH